MKTKSGSTLKGITIRFREAELKRVRIYSINNGISVSELIRQAVRVIVDKSDDEQDKSNESK